MLKKIIIIPAVCFVSLVSYAQNRIEPFQISLPEEKITGSLYTKIELADIRNDTTTLGIVQKGAFNKKANVVPEIPLATQFANVLNALIDTDSREGDLLLLLRQFSFAEVTGSLSERGYVQFRAMLFANTSEGYKRLAAIDTVVLVKAVDVTKKMFRLGSITITDFIGENLDKDPAEDMLLTMEQLTNIDSVEKANLPLYTTAAYTDGLYYSFQSFVNQQPDETGLLVSFDKKKRFVGLSYTNKKGKPQPITNQFFYAFVHEGKPYISGELTCYLLEKKNNDFCFTGRANDAKNTDVAVATAFFGIIGGLIASSATSVFEMKIDHLSGGFIRIKEIKK